MDHQAFYQSAVRLGGEEDVVLVTCVEGEFRGSKAVFRSKRLHLASPASSAAFWRRIRLPAQQGFCGLFPGPEGSEAFLEPLTPESRLVIVGAGHVGQALAHMARDCGFTVFVADARADLLTAERFPGCTLLEDAAVLPELAGPDVYFAVMAATHEQSEAWVAQVLRHTYAYVGLIGAAHRRAGVLDRLRAAGIPEERLADLVMPIGLAIGAETPQEVAVSVLAQLIGCRRKRTAGLFCWLPLYRALAEDGADRVLATVVRTAGSAPRGPGAKLCQWADGRADGSVGGGELEQDVLTVAALTMADGVPRRVYSQSEAGGRVELFVERV